MASEELLCAVYFGGRIKQDRGFGKFGILEPGFKFLDCHVVKIMKRYGMFARFIGIFWFMTVG